MSEENNKKQNAIDIANALKQDFATSVYRIYINSLKREVGFKEITVTQQKTLSRTLIENENRKDIIFDAQCALINSVCLEPETFNIYDCSEFDRLKLLIALYQSNMFKNDIKFTCKNCGAQNQFKLDFDIVLKRLDKIELTTKKYQYENKLWKFNFEIEYPSVKRIQLYYKSAALKYRNTNKNESKSIENFQNIDYINMFLKSVVIINKKTKNARTINFNDFEPNDIIQFTSLFPQDVLYSENGILKYITTEYIKKINDTFQQHECYNCGAKYENDVTTTESFL